MNLEDFLYKDGAGRDFVLTSILNRLPKPCSILELGCARDLKGHAGDGWSSVFWADFIKKHYGYLDIIDIDQNNLDNCKELLSKFNLLGDNVRMMSNYFDIKSYYDFVYIDVADDPDLTLKLYNDFKNRANFIAIDDYHKKGQLLHQKEPADIVWWLKNGHMMGGYGFLGD